MKKFKRKFIIAQFRDSKSGKSKIYVQDGIFFSITTGLYQLCLQNEVEEVEFKEDGNTITTAGNVVLKTAQSVGFDETELIKVREQAALVTAQVDLKRATAQLSTI